MEKNPPNQPLDSQASAKAPQAALQELPQPFSEFVRTLADSAMSMVLAERISRGPLPSPETLEKYKQVSPDALSLILREYFVITILFLIAGFYLILHGHDVAGASICGVGLVSVVIAFLRHTSSPSSSNGKK